MKACFWLLFWFEDHNTEGAFLECSVEHVMLGIKPRPNVLQPLFALSPQS